MTTQTFNFLSVIDRKEKIAKISFGLKYKPTDKYDNNNNLDNKLTAQI